MELSTEVNLSTRLAHNFDPTTIAKEQACLGKCVALRYSRRFRAIVIISFSPENGVRFDTSIDIKVSDKFYNKCSSF